jgi:hypothetical protein
MALSVNSERPAGKGSDLADAVAALSWSIAATSGLPADYVGIATAP